MIGSWVNYLMGQSGAAAGPSQVIETLSGKIRGKTYLVDDGRKVDAFLGIPYGQASRFEVCFIQIRRVQNFLNLAF